MGKIINPHVQWEYMTVSIRNPNDIANELNRWGKNGWECFHIDITAYGTTATHFRKNNKILLPFRR